MIPCHIALFVILSISRNNLVDSGSLLSHVTTNINRIRLLVGLHRAPVLDSIGLGSQVLLSTSADVAVVIKSEPEEKVGHFHEGPDGEAVESDCVLRRGRAAQVEQVAHHGVCNEELHDLGPGEELGELWGYLDVHGPANIA